MPTTKVPIDNLITPTPRPNYDAEVLAPLHQAQAVAAQKEAQRLEAVRIAEAKAAEQRELEQERAREVQAAQVSAPIVGGVQEMVHEATVARWGESEWPSMYQIVMHESGLNPDSINPSSGACGLFQALPCSKMGGTDINNQIQWGVNYIASRYGTPSDAWRFWLAHSWY